MPLTARNSARRRKKNPDEKLPERPEESASVEVMAPTRMKLRVRRRDNVAAGGAGGVQPEEEEERSQESGGRSSSRRKNTRNASNTAAASSSPPSSSSSASVRAVMAAEEASPDSKCPICLDRFNNLAYLDRCLHRFCFPCIQEWSHNKAECPLCKQPFASILHSVRAEDDFKEYTLRPAPANSSVAATVAMVAAMASAARSDHQMRLMLRRHRGVDGGAVTARRRRRERGGRGGSGRRLGVWEWYLDSPPALPPPHNPTVSPVVAEDSEDAEHLEEQRTRGGAELPERGVIFEGLTGLGGAVAPVDPNDRASRRLMTRLVARQRLQREGGTVRRLRDRETVAFRRALYRSAIRVHGVAGVSSNQGQQQREITAESFRRNPAHLNRLHPWLRRELTVLYGAHGSLVDIVQRIITARLARHGLEDTPTIEEELRPFLLARTDHFLHELVSFARSPLNLENYDMQAVYEPPDAAVELGGTSSSSDSSSVIAISEGEEEEQRAGGTHDDIIQAGSCLSLAAWDDETPGPSYSTAEPSCSIASPSLSTAPLEAANEEGGEKWEEEECLIVGYKKPIAERTPELVQLSSDTEEEEEKKKENTAEKLPPLPLTTTPPLSCLPTIPPSTSGACSRTHDQEPKEKDGEVAERRSRARSWSGSSGRSGNSVCTLSPAAPGDGEQRRERWRDRKSGSEAVNEKRRKKRRRRRGQERKSGTLHNPNRCIYPTMMRHLPPSPFHSSVESGSPPPPSWEYHCSQVSPLTSSISSSSSSSSFSSSSPLCSSPLPSSCTTPTPPSGNSHHGEKPSGKRKYKSRHLDSDDKDPTWRPSSRKKRREKEQRRRRRDGGRKKEWRKRECGESRRSREERSPSVEIIYEGAAATRPPASKRHRKCHRESQRSSSPVIITLDSDSSRDDSNNSNSSSPLSSQQTVDFSDLPPLPLVPSAGVGGSLNADILELPVDILDRGSDGSETEPAHPIAVDNSDDGDHDVDVENVRESGSGSDDDDDGPTGTAATVSMKTDSEVTTSDSRLLATILDDLKGISAPPDQSDTRYPSPDCPGVRQSKETIVLNQDSDLPVGRTSSCPAPPAEWLKESRVGGEVKDAPPLLKQAGPVQAHNRNTPPPLKHKDAGSPHLSAVSPSDPVRLSSHPIDSRLPEDKRTSPPISLLERHFTNSPAPPRTISANDMDPSCHLTPIHSHSVTTTIHSTSPKPPIDSHSSSRSNASPTGADRWSHLESLNSPKSGFDSTKEISSSDPGSSPADLHPVNSPIDFHSTTTEKPVHAHSTSRSCRNKTQTSNFCQVAPIDLHPFSGGGFSGVGWNNTLPPVFASSIDCRTQTPSSAVDTHSSERLPCSRVSSVSAIELHRRSPKSTVDLHSSCPDSQGLVDNKDRIFVNHRKSLPTIDLHRPVPPVNLHSSSSVSHAALPATLHTSNNQGGSESGPAVESHSKFLHLADSKLRNHFDPRSKPQFSVDYHPKNFPSFQLSADNHITSSPRSIDSHSDSQSTIDDHSRQHSATQK